MVWMYAADADLARCSLWIISKYIHGSTAMHKDIYIATYIYNAHLTIYNLYRLENALHQKIFLMQEDIYDCQCRVSLAIPNACPTAPCKLSHVP